MHRESPNGRATRGSLGRLLRIVRPRAEVGGTPTAHLVEGPLTRAARVRTRQTNACVTPSRRAPVPWGRLADILTIRVVSDLRPLSPNPLERARSNAPSLKLTPASSATDVTTYTVAAAEVLPPKRKPRGRPKGKPAAAAVAIPLSTGSAVSILKVHVPKPVPGSVALAASTDYGPSDNCRSWLLDTGCRFDLTTRAAVPPYLQGSSMKATVPIALSTANDLVNGEMVVRQQIMEFKEVAEPYILDSTPDVLSIGRRCVEDGYAFHWEPSSLAPTMITAD